MPQSDQIERARATQIERAGATDFAPSFEDLLISGDPELMRGALRRWLAMRDRPGATYVYEAWLKAGGDPDLIRASLLQWLAGNATAERASFVYSAWLNTTGEAGVVRGGVGAWVGLP